MSDEQTTRELFDAFNRRDLEALKRLAADDVETVPLRAALEGTVYRGQEGIDRFWDESEESWSEIAIEAHDIVPGPDAVFVAGRLRGRGRGTGAPVEMELGWAISFREGKATRLATYTDVAEARRAAGLREP